MAKARSALDDGNSYRMGDNIATRSVLAHARARPAHLVASSTIILRNGVRAS